MNVQHTPGPWVHYPEDNLITMPDGRGILEWQARSVHVSVAERDANARLIAASPELLEALIELTPPMPPADALCHRGIVAQANCVHCSRVARAHSAIAKATGSAS